MASEAWADGVADMTATAARPSSRAFCSVCFMKIPWLNEAGGLQFGPLGIGEQSGAGDEGLARAAFEREGVAVAGDEVDDQLCVFPVLVLRDGHVKRHAADVAEMDFIRPDGQFARQVAVGRTVIAAASGLKKEPFRSVLLFQELDQFQRGRGGG